MGHHTKIYEFYNYQHPLFSPIYSSFLHQSNKRQRKERQPKYVTLHHGDTDNGKAQVALAKALPKISIVACPKKLVLVRKHHTVGLRSKTHFLRPPMFTVVKHVSQALISAVRWEKTFLQRIF